MKIKNFMTTQPAHSTSTRQSTFVRMLTVQFIAVDCIASLFIFVPAAVTSAKKSWIMTDLGCTIHGIVITWVYLVLFGLLSLMNIEIFARIKYENWHKSTFDSERKLIMISVIMGLMSLGVACVPLSDWAWISYDYYHSACVPMLEMNLYHRILLLVLGLGLTVVIFVSTCILIGEIIKEQKDRNDSQETIQRRKTDLERKNNDIQSNFTFAQNSGMSDERKHNDIQSNFTFAQDSGISVIDRLDNKEKDTMSKPLSYNGWMKDQKDTANEPPQNSISSSSTFRHKITTNFALCSIMIIFYVPYFVVIFARADCEKCQIKQKAVSWTLVFIVLTFILRPIIFYFRLCGVIKDKSEKTTT